ncbi:MAG: hypothetical protein KJN62_09545, partial [Deltaproteobacteria bacterium]|nr:hypothetical protein [Deltaproteobacteria bacterium]
MPTQIEIFNELRRRGAFTDQQEAIIAELEKRGELENNMAALVGDISQPSVETSQAETEPAKAPEEDFKEKMLEYGQKLAYDLGMIPRWGVEGIAQAIGTFTDPFGQMMARATGREYQPLGEYAAEKLTQMGVPEEVERYKTPGAIMKTVAGTATGIGAAQKLAKGATGITQMAAKEMAAQPVQQVAGAAGASAAQQAAEEAGMGELAQTAAALGGGVLGAGAAGIPKIRVGPKAIPEGIQEAEKRGIRVLTEDVVTPETAGGKIAQSGLGKVLGGTGSQRAAQQAERAKAAQDFVKEYGGDVGTEMLDRVYDQLQKKRSFKVQAYNKLKTDVIKKLDQKGNLPVGKTISIIDKEIAAI